MRVLQFACLVLLSLGILAVPAAAATVVYKFTGDCTDCTGAVGILTLRDYTPGTDAHNSFVSFTYSSSIFAPGVLQFDSFVQGSLPALSGPAQTLIDGKGPPVGPLTNYFFQSQLNGSWVVGVDGSILDHGASHSFTLVAATPLPAAAVLLATAVAVLLGLALIRELRGRPELGRFGSPRPTAY